jgi:hypothetical protein
VSTTPQSLTIPVAAFKPQIAGLTFVFVDLDALGGGPINERVVSPTEVRGTTGFELLFDGVPANCTRGTYNNFANLTLRCPAPPDLSTIVFTSGQTTVAFSLSLFFGESACNYPSWCVAPRT